LAQPAGFHCSKSLPVRQLADREEATFRPPTQSTGLRARILLHLLPEEPWSLD